MQKIDNNHMNIYDTHSKTNHNQDMENKVIFEKKRRMKARKITFSI